MHPDVGPGSTAGLPSTTGKGLNIDRGTVQRLQYYDTVIFWGMQCCFNIRRPHHDDLRHTSPHIYDQTQNMPTLPEAYRTTPKRGGLLGCPQTGLQTTDYGLHLVRPSVFLYASAPAVCPAS